MPDTITNVRNKYTPQPYKITAGEIGRLQGTMVRHVNAGDSIAMDKKSVFRLSPLNKPCYIEICVDEFAFYVPYRHCYSNWTDFVMGGQDEGITLGTRTADATVGLQCVGTTIENGEAFLSALSIGYIQIWNNFFRIPTDDTNIKADTWLDSGGGGTDKDRTLGLLCAKKKTIWSSGVTAEVTSADYQWATGGTMDLQTHAKTLMRYNTERKDEWYGQRYRDKIKNTFGSLINTDADQRPTLIARETTYISSQDIDGSDSTTLGKYAGKTYGSLRLQFPKRLFPEHGLLYTMLLARFDPVMVPEKNWLFATGNAEPNFEDFLGIPEVTRTHPPESISMDYFHAGCGAVDAGLMPHGQWHRTEPNRVHPIFTSKQHPFIESVPTTIDEVRYEFDSEFGSIFQNQDLYQWQDYASIDLEIDSHVPPPESSIFAGTR
jgi:hypothetical protein